MRRLVLMVLLLAAIAGGCGGGGGGESSDGAPTGQGGQLAVLVRFDGTGARLEPQQGDRVLAQVSPSATRVLIRLDTLETPPRTVAATSVDRPGDSSVRTVTLTGLPVGEFMLVLIAQDASGNDVAGASQKVLIEAGRVTQVQATLTPIASPTPSPSPTPPVLPRRVYVANRSDGTISVYDEATMAEVSGSPFAAGIFEPEDLVFDAQRRRLYVTSGSASELAVLDAATMQPVAGTPLVTGGITRRVVLGNGRIYASSLFADNLTVFDAATLSEVAGSPFSTGGPGPHGMAFDAVRNRLYVNNTSAGAIAVLDATTLAQVAGSPVTTGTGGGGGAYDPVNDRAWFSSVSTNEAVVMEGGDLSFVKVATGGTFPNGVAYDGTQLRVYVANVGTSTVAVFDALTKASVGSPVSTSGQSPQHVRYDGVRNRLYAPNSESGSVAVFDAATLTQIPGSPFPTGAGPAGVDFGP